MWVSLKPVKSLVTASVELGKSWKLNLCRLLWLSYCWEGRSPWNKAADKAKAYYPFKLVILCKLLTGDNVSQTRVFIIR